VSGWVLRTDGGARGNPGPAGAGFVLERDAEVVVTGGTYLGETTNNVAEYEALIWGLENALDQGVEKLTVYCDSELVVRQMAGTYRVKDAKLKPLFDRASALVSGVGAVSIEHVRREENTAADALANQAMDECGDLGDARPRGYDGAQQTLFE
jgi:ribonuclease HI